MLHDYNSTVVDYYCTPAGYKGLTGPPGEVTGVPIKGESGKKGLSGNNGFPGPRGQSDIFTLLPQRPLSGGDSFIPKQNTEYRNTFRLS